MRRREFITLHGGTAAWPVTAKGNKNALKHGAIRQCRRSIAELIRTARRLE
jgi:hypothetical protein